MTDKMRELGIIKLVQLQPTGLIIETSTGYFYDASRRVEVDQLLITPKGIEATTPAGDHVLDIHHLDHPDKAYDDDDLVCIGFTSHYEAMRVRFGEHMVDGSAGENIVIEYEEEIWPHDLGKGIAIENSETGKLAVLDPVSFAAPCQEFSHFAAQSQDKQLPADELKSILQFLGNGRRGYLLVLRKDQHAIKVGPGDKVFMINPE
jgi:hypothetical protein